MSRSSWRFLCIPGVVWLGACMTEAKPTAPLPHEATRTINGASPTRSYIVVARSDGTLPDGLSESITALGGNIVNDSKPAGTRHDGNNFGAAWAGGQSDGAGLDRYGVMQFSAADGDQIILPPHAEQRPLAFSNEAG